MTKLEMVNEMGLVDLVQNQRQKEQYDLFNEVLKDEE